MTIEVTLNIGGAGYSNNNSEQGGWAFVANYYTNFTGCVSRTAGCVRHYGGTIEDYGAILEPSMPIADSYMMMLLVAAIKGLEPIEPITKGRVSQVTLVSHSQKVVDAVNTWRLSSRDNDWMTRNGTQVRDLDLWRVLDERCSLHNNITARLVGNVHPGAEDCVQPRCNTLAEGIATDGSTPRSLIETLEHPLRCAFVDPSFRQPPNICSMLVRSTTDKP
jgi:ribonuclease HI